MINKKYYIIILLILSLTVVFIVYECEKLNLFYLSMRFINHSEDPLSSSIDLNNCILSFFIFYNLQSYLEIKNRTMPIYLSFQSSPLRYDILGKECTALFYKGQENLLMKPYDGSCFYPFPLEPKQHQQIQASLIVIKSHFEQQNLELVLTGGSYIGSWRYHQMIPYDDDIDFYIRSHEKPKTKALLEGLSGNWENRFVFKDTEEQNQHWKLGILCWNRSIEACKIQVDFFFMWDSGGETLEFLEWPKSLKKIDYFPLRKRPFENVIFSVPKNFESYMKQQYKSNANECVFKNHAEKNQCKMESISCDLLKFKYPYKLSGNFEKFFIEFIVDKIYIKSLFIDFLDVA